MRAGRRQEAFYEAIQSCGKRAIWNRWWRSWAEMIARCRYGQARNAASYASRRKRANPNTS